MDSNSDGIDDADLLPVVIGDFAYSIWYGETHIAPLVIFSRETNSNLEPNMDLSAEGEMTLPWNQFLDYTKNNLEESLQNAGVAWSIGVENPFPKMSSASGAIGGIEFGVEPQTNNPADQPYSLVINKFDVTVGDSDFGLSDTRLPFAAATNPENGETVTAGVRDIEGNTSDLESGTDEVQVRIQRLGTSPRLYWNGEIWDPAPTFLEAILDNDASSWTLPNVDLLSLIHI